MREYFLIGLLFVGVVLIAGEWQTFAHQIFASTIGLGITGFSIWKLVTSQIRYQ